MAQKLTLAKPYAKALYQIAAFSGLFANWSEVLEFLTIVIEDEKIQKLIKNQTISGVDKASFIIDLAKDGLQIRGQNFVRLLAAEGRLSIVPEIKVLFERYREEHEKIQDVEVVGFSKFNESMLEKLKQVLEKSLLTAVNIKTSVDPNILGGYIIKAGDRVIDASVRGRLNGLYSQMAKS